MDWKLGFTNNRVRYLIFLKNFLIFANYYSLTNATFLFYWFQLLKLVQTHGEIEKFDLIFHRSGPFAGQPRGYAFVTYVTKEGALNAKIILHNKLVGQRHINVTWAHSAEFETTNVGNPKPEITIPALALSKDPKKADRISQIQAIEAKLKLMEQKEDELKINESIATKAPVIQHYQYNKDRSSNMKQKQGSLRSHDRHKKPYIRKKPRN